MARLIISFYLMLFLSLAVFVAGFIISMSFALPDPFMTGIHQKIAKGTLILLNDQFKGLDTQKTQQLIKHYRNFFGEDLSLLDQSSLNHFNKTQKQLLNSGKPVFESIEDPVFIKKQKNTNPADNEEDNNNFTFFYFKQPGTSKVWRVNFDIDGSGLSFPAESNSQTPQLEYSRFVTGMMSTVQSILKKEKKTEWKNNISKLKARSKLPIQLIQQKYLTNNFYQEYKPHPLSKNQTPKVFRYTENNGNISFIQVIPNSRYALKIGDFNVSWFTRHINDLFIITALFGLVTSFFVWLWPLCSNLFKIKKAADEFGKGNYSSRIAIGKFSPVKSISSAFNAMAQRTQDSIRAQKELTSAVSHELRTPLTRMKFALETLEHSNEQQEKDASILDIKEDIAELNTLVDELLHYARFDQKDNAINLSHETLAHWFNHTLNRLKPLAINKKLNYQTLIDGDDTAFFDTRLMSRVLDNLVQNALRYARHEVIVTLSKGSVKENTVTGYVISVEDDGSGIPENMRQHVFDAFSRIDSSRNRRTGGYGLGLAIVKRIIKAHGGKVLIANPKQLSGARFEIYFHKTIPSTQKTTSD